MYQFQEKTGGARSDRKQLTPDGGSRKNVLVVTQHDGLARSTRDLLNLAEFERELIRTRTGEGRERAKARGVILGRKPKLTGHQRREAIARREAGEVLTDIARSYNVSHSTISRLS